MILSADFEDGLKTMTGTSMAAPHCVASWH